MIKVTGIQNIKLKLRKKKNAVLSKEVMGQIAAKALDIINVRTEKGKDVNLRPFKPYSKRYEKYKKKRQGRFFTGKVNLHDKGKMLSAMQFKAKKGKAVLFFNKSDQNIKAFAHTTGSRQPLRKFFSLSKLDVKRLSRIAIKAIRNA